MTAYITINPGTRSHALTLVGKGKRRTISFREQHRLVSTVDAMVLCSTVSEVVYREPPSE